MPFRGAESTARSVPAVRQATAGEVAWIGRVLAEAFQAGPVAAWLVPDPDERLAISRDLFATVVASAVPDGTVHVTDDLSGVAVWRDRIRPAADPPSYRMRLLAATGRWADRFDLLDQLLLAYHPGSAHHHLAYLGVRPARQGRGLAGALLRHHHRLLDAARLPGYLVAGDPGARDRYQRHGYHADGCLTLPEGGPPLWPMWRPPDRPDRPGCGSGATE
ncbi:GNAT family N-acetyltransferase [Plantactinospora solaniradicis]|uniref:GNAT family N-acetyltransferase n=1 Tax=Plantactinospora solaniradicis TaxID=1723736 RepID=A0ABW1KMV4_9ACTN